MKRDFRSMLLAALLAITAMVAWTPGASAAEQPGDMTIQGIGQRTDLVFDDVWAHFQPTLNSPYISIQRGWNIASICTLRGADGKNWNLIYEHDNKYMGFTYQSYLTTPSTQPCGSTGQAADLDGLESAWVHLHPSEDWAAETVYQSHDIATICYVWRNGPWDMVIDHNTNVVGFTYTNYLTARTRSTTPCD